MRRAAGSALGKIGPAAKDAVPALMNMLNDADIVCRGRAATALGGIGAAAKASVPELIRVLESPSTSK